MARSSADARPLKTLVVAPNWIGDALMAQPLLTLLRRADPAQTIVALAPRWVAPVLEAMPEVDDVIATDLAHGALQWSARRTFARELAGRRFDRAFVLPNSFKSALIPWLARIPLRVGYRGESRYGVLNRRSDAPDPRLAMSARYAALAPLVGIDVAAPAAPNAMPLPTPRLVVAADRIAAARGAFGLDDPSDLVALCPGAEYGPAKRWPTAHFAALARRLLETRPDAHVILLGGNGDRAATTAIVADVGAGSDRLHDLAGRTDLSQAIALIAGSAAVVSNDSGLMHVAAALTRPQVALFGSSDPRHTPPLSAAAKVLWLHLDCSPCFERTCPLGHLNCLVQITPDRVAEATAEALMSRNEPMRNNHPDKFPTRTRWSS